MRARTASALVVVAIVLLAVNLRPTAVSVGPVLDELRSGLDMTAWQASLLTALPVLAFAGFGALAPRAAALVGPHTVTLVALLAVVVGLVGRAVSGDVALFLVLSVVALAGMATSNVLLPSLVRRHFPDRIGAMTAIYTTALSCGLTAAFLVTVPVADAFGTWRAGLGVWALAAAVAAVPWLALLRLDRGAGRDVGREVDGGPDPDGPVETTGAAAEQPDEPPPTFGELARTRLGWAMAVFFGLQSLHAYAVFGWFATLWRDAGFGATTASALVGVVAGVSIPLSLVVPRLVARPGDQRWVIALVAACYPVAYLGLAVSPHRLALLWALLLGVAGAVFPIALVLLGLRSRTPGGTAALSGFSQSLGYLLAAAGPFGTGALHDATGGWTVPLVVLAVLAVPMLLLGLYVGRPTVIEEHLRDRPGRPAPTATGA